MTHIIFLASGNGGNLKFFYLAQKRNIVSNIRLSVIADRECGSISFARENSLENYVINYKKSNSSEFIDILEELKPDIIVTNWHKIIDESTVQVFNGRLINLHYSLLPAFGGLIGIEPIKRAYAQGCKYIGPTCHLVDEGVDTGKIISQAIFKTNIPIHAAIDLMFRKGCLVLLNGIQQVVGKKIVEELSVSDDLSYSPSLGFDEKVFPVEFWKDLAVA